MRAKTIHNTCVVFDLDDTLIKSEGLVYVYKNDKFIKTLTSQEFSNYRKKSDEILDFSDFRDGSLIVNALKYKAWPTLQKLYNDNIEIYILTGRNELLQPHIHKLLKNNKINIKLDHIITIGDNRGDINIALEKKKILKKMSKYYDKIFFFDNDKINIKLASTIPGLKTKLIETLSFERGLDPKDATKIGIKDFLINFDVNYFKIADTNKRAETQMQFNNIISNLSFEEIPFEPKYLPLYLMSNAINYRSFQLDYDLVLTCNLNFNNAWLTYVSKNRTGDFDIASTNDTCIGKMGVKQLLDKIKKKYYFRKPK
jgi:mRNA-degrading endonuclease YafQ of YafQ-DinJ toxin-antitoxin module